MDAYNENEYKIIEKQEFLINLNNKKYVFELGKSTKAIIFKISDKTNNNTSTKYYLLNLTIEELITLNDFFKIYKEDINGIYTFLLDIIRNNYYEKELKDHFFRLKIHYYIPGKTFDFIFDLKENKIPIDDILEKFASTINYLLSENVKIKKIIENKDNEIRGLKEKCSELENKIKIYEEIKKKKIHFLI